MESPIRRLGCAAQTLALTAAAAVTVLATSIQPAHADPIPPAPPAAINPPPYLKEVSWPGPTRVGAGSGYVVAKDMVWGPQGSPYIIVGEFSIGASQSLTLLPGTVVKFELGPQLTSRHSLVIQGSLYALGTPDNRVTFTSVRDDSVGGDTNADGSATAPARGDWHEISVGFPGSVGYLNYVDVKYGGSYTQPWCHGAGAIAGRNDTHVVVSNTRISHSYASGLLSSTNRSGYFGVFDSEVDSSACGMYAGVANGPVMLVGNRFQSGIDGLALEAQNIENLMFNHNVAHRPVTAAPTPGGKADTRFNSLLGGFGSGNAIANWYGRNINEEILPLCMTEAAMDAYVPRLRIKSYIGSCPTNQYEPEWANPTVIPALSGPPGSIPSAIYEAAAPRYSGVDTYRGVLRYSTEDMLVQDAGKTLAATRTYRSDHTAEGDAGPGWSTSFSEALSTLQGVSSLTLSDGSSLPFAVDPAAGYVPAGGVVADFQTGAGGSTVASADQTVFQFNPAGELTGLLLGDSGHQVAVERAGGKPTKVTGVSGRYLRYQRSGGRLTQVLDSQGRTVTMSYAAGRLSGVSGADGQSELYEYDGQGRLTKVTSPSGVVKLAASYGGDGKVAWIEEAGRGRSTFAYDIAHKKTVITRADGSQVIQHYDSHGRITTEQIVGGSAKHVLYDGSSRPTVEVTGVPSVALEGYQPIAQATLADVRGDIVATVDPSRKVVDHTFNSGHKPLTSVHGDGGTITRTYNGAGRLASVTDQLGKVWSYTYNGRGQVLTQTNPLSQNRTLTYEADGDLATVTDPAGAVTRYEYDDLGRPVVTVDARGDRHLAEYTTWGEVRVATLPSGAATTREFNVDRRLAGVVNALGKRTIYEYDTQGRPSAMVDPIGQRVTAEYDLLGRPNRRVDVRGGITLIGYQPDGSVASETGPSGALTTVVNDPAGRPIRVTNALGQVTQTTYFPGGQIAKLERPDGSAQQYSLDAVGRVATHTTARGNVWAYTYDLAGHRIQSTDPLGYFQQWGYDDLGRVASHTDELGRVTQTSYNDTARTVTVTDTIGTANITGYDAVGHVVSATDGSGRITTHEYDDDGLKTASVDAAGGRTVYGYDPVGRQTSTTDPVGRVTTLVLDDLGRATRVTDPAIHTTVYTHEPDGQIETVTDRTGGVTTYDHDLLGLLKTITDPLGKQTTFTYDELGRQKRIKDPTGVQRNTAYDPVGRPAVEWDTIGASWVTRYDPDGNVSERIDPAGVHWKYTYNNRDELTIAEWDWFLRKWTFTYDKIGNLATSQRPGGVAESFTYDQRRRQNGWTNEEGHTTSYGYDGAGRQASVTLPSGKVTSWTYDNAGRMATAVDGLGNTSRYEHDLAGQLKKLTLPRNGIYEYTYDAIGALATETDPNNKVTRFFYDNEARPARTETPAGRVILSRYDTAGRLWQTEAGGIVRTLSYDDAGRLATAHVDGQPDSAYTYNSRGLLATSTDRLGLTTFGYDDAGRLSVRTPPTGIATTYTYVDGQYSDGHGMLATVRGATNVNYEYNADGTTNRRSFVWPSASRSDVFTYAGGRLTGTGGLTYGYNQDGQLETVSEPVAGSNEPKVTTLGYDDAGHLGSQVTTHAGTTLSSTSYGWDGDGNRSSVTEAAGTPLTFSYDLAGRLLSASDGTTYTYDDDGNQIEAAGSSLAKTLDYNAFGELSEADQPSGAIGYVRDALGRAAARTVGGSTQSLGFSGPSGDVSAAKLDTGPLTNVINGLDGEILGEATTGGTSVRASTNIHRDVINWQNDATGAETSSTRYDPFGLVQATTGASPSVNFGFQGSVTDSASGLVDMGFRPYDPATARFTSPDNIVGAYGKPVSLNRYAYGNGDPINHLDPDGHWPDWLDDFVGWWKSEFTAGLKSDKKTSDPIGRFMSSAVRTLGSEIADSFRTAGVGVKCAKQDQASCDAIGKLFTWESAKAVWHGTVGPIKKAWRSGTADDWGVAAAGVIGLFFGTKGFGHIGVDVPHKTPDIVDGAPQITKPSRGPDRDTSPDTCEGHSFSPDTKVLMADGTTKAIADIKIGDKVAATDPETTETAAQSVTALHVNVDEDLTDVTLSSTSGEESTLHTTQHHPFWDAARERWTDASDLVPGESTLIGPDGSTVRVLGVRSVRSEQAMRDLTVDTFHSYYVMTDDQPVLVHNCGTGNARFIVDSDGVATDLRPPTPRIERPAIEASPTRLAIEGPKAKKGLTSAIGNVYQRHKFAIEEGLRRAYAAQDTFTDSVGRDLTILPSPFDTYLLAGGRALAWGWGFWRGYRQWRPPSK